MAIGLIALNVLIVIYARFTDDSRAANARIEQLQINPERIKLIAAATRGPGGQAQTDGVFACLQWGPLVGASLARADAVLAQIELAQPAVQRAVADAGGYWVYVPPSRNPEQTLNEIHALGIVDAFIVQDPARWRNAISLGIFKSEQAARSFLAGVQQKGATSAVAERRENFFKSFAYFVREPDKKTVAQFADLQRAFPGTEIRAAACPF